jgi:hypothetical protein
MVLNRMMVVKVELGEVWVEAVMSYFRVIFVEAITAYFKVIWVGGSYGLF